MKLFNSKEEYVEFINKWKEFVNAGGATNRPEVYMIYNILKGRDSLYGFQNIKSCTLHTIASRLSFERYVLAHNDNRSIIKKLVITTPIELVKYLNILVDELHALAREKSIL